MEGGKFVIKSQLSAPADQNKAINSIVSDLHRLCENRPTNSLAAGKAEKTGDTIKNIITAARVIFTRDGHAGLSLRKVADHAGIAVGNLTYHFPTKRSLLGAILIEARADYAEEHLTHFQKSARTPFEILLNVMEHYVLDARHSHRFFLQMWGYAASDEDGKAKVHAFYQQQGRIIYYLVREANPKLNDAQIRQAVLQISSLEEGFKMFLGTGAGDDVSLKTAEQQIREMTERIVFSDGRAT